MKLVWYPTLAKDGVEANGGKGDLYRIVRATHGFWFCRGDRTPNGQKGSKRKLLALARLIEDERCKGSS